MNGERAKLIIKLILGIAAIAVCCLFIIFVMLSLIHICFLLGSRDASIL